MTSLNRVLGLRQSCARCCLTGPGIGAGGRTLPACAALRTFCDLSHRAGWPADHGGAGLPGVVRELGAGPVGQPGAAGWRRCDADVGRDWLPARRAGKMPERRRRVAPQHRPVPNRAHPLRQHLQPRAGACGAAGSALGMLRRARLLRRSTHGPASAAGRSRGAMLVSRNLHGSSALAPGRAAWTRRREEGRPWEPARTAKT